MWEKTKAVLAAQRAQAELERKTDVALNDKAALLAERVANIPKAIEQVLDTQLARLDNVQARGAAAGVGLTKFVDDVDAAVSTTEGVVRQLSNGGPA